MNENKRCERCGKEPMAYSTGLCYDCESKDRILMDYWDWKKMHNVRLGLWAEAEARAYDKPKQFVYDAINLVGTFWKPSDEVRTKS